MALGMAATPHEAEQAVRDMAQPHGRRPAFYVRMLGGRAESADRHVRQIK